MRPIGDRSATSAASSDTLSAGSARRAPAAVAIGAHARTAAARDSARRSKIGRPPPSQGGDLPQRVAAHGRRPAYHVLPDATGGRRWQRNSLVFAVPRASRFAAGCHRLRLRGSITAPSVSAKLRVERPAVGCLQVAALGAFTPREDSQRCRRSFDGPLPDGPDPACRPARHCPN